MLRVLILLLLATTPARAWQASAEGRICVLSHAMAGAAVRLTYDPAIPLYTIAITRSGAVWPDAPGFSIRFDGPRGLSISTDRQVLSDGGATLTVTDTGFGNVLDGLEFNATATAIAGDTALAIPLAGAAQQVRAFRGCTEGLQARRAGEKASADNA